MRALALVALAAFALGFAHDRQSSALVYATAASPLDELFGLRTVAAMGDDFPVVKQNVVSEILK